MTGRPVVRYLRSLGSVPRPGDPAWRLVGQDGGQSVDLGGRTLFLYSDTLFTAAGENHRPGPRPPFPVHTPGPAHFLANCAAVSTGARLPAALAGQRYFCADDGLPREILPGTPEERRSGLRFWPLHGIGLHGVVYLWYLGVQATGAGTMWDFRNVGTGLARLDPDTGDCRRVRRDGDWRLWPATSDDLHFGVQVMREAGVLYVFGSRRLGLDVSAFVARVAPDDLADPAAYAYLQPGTGRWVSELDRAGSLGPCGGDYSVSFNRHLGGYLMVYVDSFTKWLQLRVADHPCGPYGPPARAGRLPHRAASELIYLAFEHPTFATHGGSRVFVSYSQPAFTPNSLLVVGFS